jgi:hypothetical protein
VEETPLLIPVEGIVRGIEIQHDPRRRSLMDVEEVLHEQILDRLIVIDDLVVARGRRRLGRRPLQTVERAPPRQRMAPVALPTAVDSAEISLARRQRQQGVVPQRVVIVEILVALGLGQHPLAQQLLDRVLEKLRPAVISEAGREASDQSRALRHLPQQQDPRIRGLSPAVEGGHHLPAPERLKLQLTRTTVCVHRADPPVHDLSWNNKPLAGTVGRCVNPSVRYPG